MCMLVLGQVKHNKHNLHRSQGDARTGYFIPGCDGIGGWRSSENSSSVAAAAAPPPSRKRKILSFLEKSKKTSSWGASAPRPPDNYEGAPPPQTPHLLKAHLPPTTCELFFRNCTFSEKGDGGDGDGRRIFRRPPPPYPIAPRDEISRSGIPLTSMITYSNPY